MKITIAGGDLRMITAGKLLADTGYQCCGFGFGNRSIDFPVILPKDIPQTVADSDAVILPLPCERDGYLNTPFSETKFKFHEILSFGSEKTLFIGGRMPMTGENFIDYSQREDFQIKNAVPTAEGAIALAMNELKITLFGAKTVVVGYGRIGKYLSSVLKNMGASVTAAARSPHSRAFAATNGINAVDFNNFEAPLSEADVVFNTVPSAVIGEKQIAVLPPDCVIIDLASLPGGVDETAAQNYGIKFLRALSLPGKVAPITAGRTVFETVFQILREKGVAP